MKVTDLRIENDRAADNVFQAWHQYTDHRLGFSAFYPADWTIEASGKTSIDFLPSDMTQEGLTIGMFTPATAKPIRESLNIVSEKPVIVDGETGSLITSDSGHHAFETTVLVVHDDRLYYFSGPATQIREFLLNFRFINSDL